MQIPDLDAERDTRLDSFHAIGKLLYNKRDASSSQVSKDCCLLNNEFPIHLHRPSVALGMLIWCAANLLHAMWSDFGGTDRAGHLQEGHHRNGAARALQAQQSPQAEEIPLPWRLNGERSSQAGHVEPEPLQLAPR